MTDVAPALPEDGGPVVVSTLMRPYYDATAFGDTARTYMVGGPLLRIAIGNAAFTFTAGAGGYDQAVAVLQDLNHFLRTLETPAARRRRENAEDRRLAIADAIEQLRAIRDHPYYLGLDIDAATWAPPPPADPFLDGETPRTDAEKKAADEKANKALRRYLTAEQWQSLLDRGWFNVKGRSGQTYRIDQNGEAYRVDRRGEADRRYCIYLYRPRKNYSDWGSPLPTADTILAKLLYIQANDKGFISRAGRFETAPSERRRLSPN